MKHKLILSLLGVAAVVASCQQFDDSSLWEKLYELSEEVSKLKAQCNQMNSDLTNLKSVVSALQVGEFVTACSELADGSGYTLVFSSGKSIVLRNGKDGTNASAPKISVRKDSDGVYYWTIDGDWLLDEGGMKIKAEGRDGEDGADAVAPQLKIGEGYWYISVDGGKTWTRSGKATGEDGQDGDNLFRSVTVEDGVLVIILNDDSATRIELPMGVSPDTMVITGDVDEIDDFTAKAYGVCRMEDVPGASVIYGIEYSNTDLNSAPVSVRAERRDSEGSFVCLLSDLMYDTLYYYRAYCFNNGVKSYGEIKTFKTLPIVESVDLGFSVKWSGCNLGASKPKDYGGYYWSSSLETVFPFRACHLFFGSDGVFTSSSDFRFHGHSVRPVSE